VLSNADAGGIAAARLPGRRAASIRPIEAFGCE